MNKEDERIYSCDDCGKLRSKDEGGTTFTVCDECWDKRFGKQEPAESVPPTVVYRILRKCPHCRKAYLDDFDKPQEANR